MSRAELKALLAIAGFEGLRRQGFLKIYAKEIEPLYRAIEELYIPSITNVREYSRFMRICVMLDELLEEEEFDYTFTAILSFIMTIAEEFYRHCTGRRKIVWGNFIDYCMKNEFIQHSMKKQDYSEIERAIPFGEKVLAILDKI